MEENEFDDEYGSARIFVGRDEESLFARGEDDALIRYVKPTLEKFKEMVTVIIDGESVTVPKAKPQTDAQGNPKRDRDGQFIPRDTTIYDAAMALVDKGAFSKEEMESRIPVLCHLKHLDPIAVCRMCSVQVSNIKRGKFTAGRKLVPACQHRVEDKMAVQSRLGPRDPEAFRQLLASAFGIKQEELPRADSITKASELVQKATRFLGELLVADHLHADPERGDRYLNELQNVATVVEATDSNRFSLNLRGANSRNEKLHPKSRPIELPVLSKTDRAPTKELPATNSFDQPPDHFVPSKDFPYSSRTVNVDHDRCIVCDRCVRSCSEVKPFRVIGHTGKGYRTRISFDLDQLMSGSSCVQCGECMTSCPTGALTLNRRVAPSTTWDVQLPWDPAEPLPSDFLTVEQMQNDVSLSYKKTTVDKEGKETSENIQFNPFRDISYPFLRWNEGAVRRRRLRDKEVICTQGDFGSTAFFLEKGKFEVEIESKEGGAEPETDATGFWSWFGSKKKAAQTSTAKKFTLAAEDALVLGEIACLTKDRRTATVRAVGDVQVLEVTQNVLATLQRSPSARKVLDDIYRRRAIENAIANSPRFKTLSFEQRQVLVRKLASVSEMRHVEPGEVIIKEHDRVGFDVDGVRFLGDLYIIHQGFVKVSKMVEGQERVFGQLNKGIMFGEIALLPDHPVVTKARDELGINPFERTATCSALADVEIIRIPGYQFRKFFHYESNPDRRNEFSKIADQIAIECVKLLTEQRAPLSVEDDRRAEFLRQGIYQGQKMLVLDLTRCTRCDECTRACADSHGDGHSRLLREGLRFGDFLVAASCRSCHQPYCMDGCPVDAIHRDAGKLEILIENHCVGCGLCEKNCPYGSIQMVPRQGGSWKELFADLGQEPKTMAQVARKAVNCDLCHSVGGDPFCVAACPHEAAFRWDDKKLLSKVEERGG